jgi:hypothetical protein
METKLKEVVNSAFAVICLSSLSPLSFSTSPLVPAPTTAERRARLEHAESGKRGHPRYIGGECNRLHDHSTMRLHDIQRIYQNSIRDTVGYFPRLS